MRYLARWRTGQRVGSTRNLSDAEDKIRLLVVEARFYDDLADEP